MTSIGINLGDIAHPDAWRDEDLATTLRECRSRRGLVIGNHDETEIRVFAVVGSEEQSHEPLRRIPPGAVNVHGHVHEGIEATRRHINLTVEQTATRQCG